MARLTVTKQYANFRPSPSQFPSYDRLHFIRLDSKLLPDGTASLAHHPCLLYHTVTELIRDTELDLPTKHSLIKEWRREPKSVVRLIGWRDTVPKEGVYFPDSSVDLIRVNPDSDRLLDFYQSLESFEAACATLETQYQDVLEEIPDDADALQMKQFCQRWRASVWYSLNMLAVDLGEEVSPFNAGNTVGSNNGAAAAVSGKPKALEDADDQNKSKLNAGPPSTPMANIQPHTPWATVWKILRSKGWKWQAGSSLMTGYYYIKPGKKIKGGVEKVDYFVKIEDVQDFCREEYGWIDGKEQAGAATVVTEADDPKVDNAEIPPLINALDPHSPWETVLDAIMDSGWSYGFPPKRDQLAEGWCYIKPGKKIKGGSVNVDYIIGEASLKEYVKRCYGWIGEDGKPETKRPKLRRESH
eukprot:scaffold4607_cov39-Cyclotella_meneghiniana.AAC.11